MKIAFIGYYDSFQYNKIGGSDSIVRRLSNYLSKKHEIYLLSYGSRVFSIENLKKNINQGFFKTFDEMLQYIDKESITNSVCVYICPRDYLKLFIFKIKIRKLFFHALIMAYEKNAIRRLLFFSITSALYNGHFFCISKRIFQGMKVFSKKAMLILPPVDDNFFSTGTVCSERKDKIRISYLGRLDYGKGADLAYNFFMNSQLDNSKYEFHMYAYPHKNDSFSMDLHDKLLKQNKIIYHETQLYGHSEKVDNFLARLIDCSDIFLLPYRFIDSTIDMPLVPMEIMSRGKAFIFSNIDGMSDLIYDEMALLEKDDLNDHQIISNKIQDMLNNNHTTIANFVLKSGFKTSIVSDKMLSVFE